MSYLEDFLEKIAALPIDVNRGLRLIREIDTKFQEANERLEEVQQEYLNRLKNAKDKKLEASKPENQAMLEEIRILQEQCVNYSKFKVDISTQSFEVLEMNMEKLDNDLKKFEEEIKINEDQLAMSEDHLFKEAGKRTGAKQHSSKYRSKAKIEKSVTMPPEIVDTALTGQDGKEERYCVCNGLSYGEMIECENPYCEKLWFHFACIGLTSKPKGKWFCKDCKNKPLLKKF